MNVYDYFTLSALVVFLAVLIGRTVILTGRGVRIFVIGEGKRGFERFLELMFFVFFPVWLAGVFITAITGKINYLPDLFSQLLYDSENLKIGGSFLLVLSVVIFSAALAAFKDSWRVGIDRNNPGALVTGGIFSFSRNPIFFSMYLFFTGVFLIYSNVFFLTFAVGTIAGIHLQILQEEKFLTKFYGDSYKRYISVVRRYF